MNFAPKPENDFAEYIRTYYRECRYRFDRIEGIAGKWMFRDLIPGMSDFDTRFILNDRMTADDWCAMSSAIGETHLALCQKYPVWARNLEHLPGVNLTWAELTAERSYYPEFQLWTYYHTEHPDRISAALDQFARRPWDIKDEYFHLKRFCLYYGRYDRAIDPPINLSIHVTKYPLHSRLMHYFNPPVLSAVCLLEKHNFAGKMDAFELAGRLFPELPCWQMVSEILHGNYETPQWYAEPDLTALEDALEDGLRGLAQALRGHVTLVPPEAGVDIAAWKHALQRAPMDPALVIFDNAKFARLLKGRLWFYVHAPARFATAWLIQNELRRIGYNFFRMPFQIYWRLKAGESVENPADILGQLQGDLLTRTEVEATREFDRLTAAPTRPGDETSVATAIVAVFDDFFRALTKISEAVG
jgi:hypothetical protein